MALKVRPVEEGDRRLLWEWANDDDVRSSAVHTGPIPWSEHVRWFAGKTADPDCHIYIVIDQSGAPVGQVRFDVSADGSAETDISIARVHRGRGLGVEALRISCAELFEQAHVDRILAHVRNTNRASVHAFRKAGFAECGCEKTGEISLVRFMLERLDEV